MLFFFSPLVGKVYRQVNGTAPTRAYRAHWIRQQENIYVWRKMFNKIFDARIESESDNLPVEAMCCHRARGELWHDEKHDWNI